MQSLGILVIAIIVVIVAIAILWFVFAKLYQRSSTEISFVRTGLMGQKVVISGGAVVIPVLHDLLRVNMNSVRLGVRRENERALITRDRMRADVEADFYVRVSPERDAVALAAQTLGARTMSPDALKELIEGKFIDALRAVAAEMSMEELHEKRQDFARKVQGIVAANLAKNGLDLDSVSVTRLDQTDRKYFNPNNAFDAEGLTRLTQEIEARRKTRNEIEQDSQVAVQMKNLQAEQRMLEIARDEEYARLTQEREIATRRAEQQMQIAQETATRKRESEEHEIQAGQAVERARIASDAAVAEERIARERAVKEQEIARSRALEIAEIDKRRALEIAEQEREIAISEMTKKQSAALAEAERARATAAKAEEGVITTRDVERAERRAAVEVVAARAEAEKGSIAALGAAETERKAAEAKGQAVKTLAEAERVAEDLRAAAAKLRYAVDAEGREALNAADNVMTDEARAMRVKLAVIERLEALVRESVKPLERIEGIKIVQVDGLGGGYGYGTAGGGGLGGEGPASLSDQVINSALRYRAQAPIIDTLLREVGLSSGDLGNISAQMPGMVVGDED
ncbi:MAG: flotillin domain-containing protein [Sneathiellaceae bacterium]